MRPVAKTFKVLDGQGGCDVAPHRRLPALPFAIVAVAPLLLLSNDPAEAMPAPVGGGSTHTTKAPAPRPPATTAHTAPPQAKRADDAERGVAPTAR